MRAAAVPKFGPMVHRLLLTGALITLGSGAMAQHNAPGTLHIAAGVALGAHATTYEQTVQVLGVNVTTRKNDGAATVTVPIEVHYGISRAFSLGLSIEPGTYLDSSATRRNGLFLLALQPRLHIVNKDRFAWTAALHLGLNNLRITDGSGATASDARYGGGHFGLGTAVIIGFSDRLGLGLRLRSLHTTMPLRSYELNGTVLSSDLFKAVLRTNGVLFQASLCLRL